MSLWKNLSRAFIWATLRLSSSIRLVVVRVGRMRLLTISNVVIRINNDIPQLRKIPLVAVSDFFLCFLFFLLSALESLREDVATWLYWEKTKQTQKRNKTKETGKNRRPLSCLIEPYRALNSHLYLDVFLSFFILLCV